MKIGISTAPVQLALVPLGPRLLHPLRGKLRLVCPFVKKGSDTLWHRLELECGHVVERRASEDHERTRCERCPPTPARLPAAVKPRGTAGGDDDGR